MINKENYTNALTLPKNPVIWLLKDNPFFLYRVGDGK